MSGFSSRQEIEASQLQQLQALLKVLLPANPFYTRKLGDSLSIESLANFSQRVPFTTKSEIVRDQNETPPYGTNRTFPLETYTRFNQTSATTGNPLRWLDTPQSWDWMLGCWNEVLAAANVNSGARIFFAFSFGPFLGFWTAFEAAAKRGCLCIPGGGLSSEGRVRAIIDNEASVLCCTPTYAIRLGETASFKTGESPVRTIIVAGEPGGSIAGVRHRIEELWPGARVFDHHGMTEIGPVTFECPARSGVLHIIEHGYYSEIVDPQNGAPVATGETGELVLTNLGRTASPLVRYRTGDLVRRCATEGCECGRSDMALEGGILGRLDDMIIVRGVNVFPGAVEEIVRRFPEVTEYQVEIDARDALPQMCLHIETSSNADAVAKSIEDALRAALTLRVPVNVAPENSLPRFEMKAKRWVRR